MAAIGGAGGLAPLVAGSALFGVCWGLLSLVQGALVQRGAPPAAQRRVFSGLHSMYGLSSVCAPLLVRLGAHAGLDWRASFRALALVPLVLLAATVPLGHPPSPGSPGSPGPPRRPDAVDGRAGDPARRSGAFVVGLMTALYCSAELALSTRLVLHLRREAVGPDVAAAYLLGFFACMLAGRVALGVAPLRLGNRQVLALSAGLSLGSTVLGLAVHPAFFCVSGLTMAPFYPTASALVADEFPEAFEAAMGTLITVTCVVVMATHWGVGVLSEVVTLERALWWIPCALAGTLGLLVLSWPRTAASART
jgi:hypothetical protein